MKHKDTKALSTFSHCENPMAKAVQCNRLDMASCIPAEKGREQRSVCVIGERCAVVARMHQVDYRGVEGQINRCLDFDGKHDRESGELTADFSKQCVVQAG